MTESSGWNFRLTALKGSETRVTDSTMSRLWIISISTLAVLPMSPKTVWYSPWETWTPKFCSSSQWMRCWVRSGDAPGFKTAIMVLLLLSYPRHWAPLPAAALNNKNATQNGICVACRDLLKQKDPSIFSSTNCHYPIPLEVIK